MRVLRALLTGMVAAPLVAAVVVTASRVGDTARFVTLPVVGVTALSGVVALVGVWSGFARPLGLAGLPLALVLSYFLPAAPFIFIAVVLVVLGAAALIRPEAASGLAAGTGILLSLFVVLQGPAVECGNSSVSISSGPWWIDDRSAASSWGSSGSGGTGDFAGTTQIGQGQYEYTCDDGRLITFRRTPNRA